MAKSVGGAFGPFLLVGPFIGANHIRGNISRHLYEWLATITHFARSFEPLRPSHNGHQLLNDAPPTTLLPFHDSGLWAPLWYSSVS